MLLHFQHCMAFSLSSRSKISVNLSTQKMVSRKRYWRANFLPRAGTFSPWMEEIRHSFIDHELVHCDSTDSFPYIACISFSDDITIRVRGVCVSNVSTFVPELKNYLASLRVYDCLNSLDSLRVRVTKLGDERV